MIFLVLIFEFFKIGLFAIGGGMVTIPFLFDLTKKYDWFTAHELTNMIAISQSTPGPIGVNMATYAGFEAAGIIGGIVATVSLVFPSVSKLLKKWAESSLVCEIMLSIRPVVVILILQACFELCKLSVTNYIELVSLIFMTALIYFYKKSPIFYILFSAIAGIVLKF